MTMRRGIVVAVHPEDHSVDLVMADDGSRLTGVQVMTPNGSTRSGTVDLPAIPEKKDKWDITKRTEQEMLATVGYIGCNPVVVGFMYPQVNQMLLKDPKARRFRHQSDVETLIDGDGNMQISHPSGTYIRIGEAIESDGLDGKHADSSATDRNQAKAVNIHIGMAGGALELTMSPSGAVSLRCNQGVSIDAGMAVTVKAPSVTLDTPSTTLTGDLTVQGSTSVQGITSNGKNIDGSHAHSNSGGPGPGGPPV